MLVGKLLKYDPFVNNPAKRMDKFNEQLFGMIERCKRGSKMASTSITEPRVCYMENGIIVSKPLESKSKAASVPVPTERENKALVIANFIKNKV